MKKLVCVRFFFSHILNWHLKTERKSCEAFQSLMFVENYGQGIELYYYHSFNVMD